MHENLFKMVAFFGGSVAIISLDNITNVVKEKSVVDGVMLNVAKIKVLVRFMNCSS